MPYSMLMVGMTCIGTRRQLLDSGVFGGPTPQICNLALAPRPGEILIGVGVPTNARSCLRLKAPDPLGHRSEHRSTVILLDMAGGHVHYARGTERPSTGVTSTLRPIAQTSTLTANSSENKLERRAGRRKSTNLARQVAASVLGSTARLVV